MLVQEAARLLGSDRAWLVRIQGPALTVEAGWGARGEAPAGTAELARDPRLAPVLEAGRPALLSGLGRDGAPRRRDSLLSGLRHALVRPLAMGGATLGALILGRIADPGYTEVELGRLEPLCPLAALLLANVELDSRAREATASLQSFVQMAIDEASEIARFQDPRRIIEALVEHALRVADADRCTLTSVDQKVLRVEASHERGGQTALAGREYAFGDLERQPLLKEAISKARITIGHGFRLEAADPQLVPALAEIRQVAVVPLMSAARVSAVLILSRQTERAFLEQDMVKVQQIGTVAILALKSARSLAAARQAQQRGLDALHFTSEHLAGREGLPAFFGRLSATVAGLVGARRAAFWTLIGEDLFPQQEAYGFGDDLFRHRIPTAGSEAMEELIRGGRTISARIEAANRAGPYGKVLKALRIKDLIAVPWRTAQRPLGVLTALDSEAGFSEEDVWVLRIAARASALVWQGHEARAQLQEMREHERAALQEHAIRFEQLERMKADFLRLASHELRGPLAIARGYVSMLEEDSFGQVSAPGREALRVVVARLGQMNLIIDQLLDAARLEDSRLALAMVPLSLSTVVSAAFAEMEPLRSANQHMVLQIIAPEARVRGDPDKLKTIVANLLSNAIKYAPQGGEIRCRVLLRSGIARVEVVDQGMGITPEERAILFQRFGRIEKPETANIDGTGLGLYLSRELARLHGGDLTVASARGRGSRFVLTLPALPADTAPEPSHPS